MSIKKQGVKNSSKSTGPTTEKGKAVSSRNATKKGIFVKGYLPGEDASEQQALVHYLMARWKVEQYPERLTHIRDIEETDLRIARIRIAERRQIEGAMLSKEVAFEFAQHARLPASVHAQLPPWYFRDDAYGLDEKDMALFYDRVQEQALDLKARFCDQIIPFIEQEFPQLHEYVLEGFPLKTSFITALGQRYKQSAPTLNLGLVSNEIGEHYRMHILWASDPVTFETIIEGIRGRITNQILCDDKTNRHIVSAQNRKLRSECALAASVQLTWQMQDREQMIYSQTVESKDAVEQTVDLDEDELLSANVSMVVIVQSNANANTITRTMGT
jgi:hypothetical protein